MKISLEKGGTISLSKANEGLEKVLFGAGWDLNEGTGGNFDLDISAVLREGGKDCKSSESCFLQQPKVRLWIYCFVWG